jgi:predicted nucleic acid-binding protein
LVYAIESKVDMLITGDKDFDEIKVENIKILKVRDYIERYMK